MEKSLWGIPDQKLVNLLAALGCAAVGAIFINLSLNSLILNSGHGLFIGGLSPVQYSFVGIGFIFLVVSVFFVHEAFRNGFFNPESSWKDGIKFCKILVLLWLVLYCLDFIYLFIGIFTAAITHIIS